MSSYKKPSNYTSIPVTCSTSREPLKTSKIDRIQQSPWHPATLSPSHNDLATSNEVEVYTLQWLVNSSTGSAGVRDRRGLFGSLIDAT